MRRLLLRNIPEQIQKVIRTKARADHIRNEEAVLELIRELEIETLGPARAGHPGAAVGGKRG